MSLIDPGALRATLIEYLGEWQGVCKTVGVPFDADGAASFLVDSAAIAPLLADAERAIRQDERERAVAAVKKVMTKWEAMPGEWTDAAIESYNAEICAALRESGGTTVHDHTCSNKCAASEEHMRAMERDADEQVRALEEDE